LGHIDLALSIRPREEFCAVRSPETRRCPPSIQDTSQPGMCAAAQPTARARVNPQPRPGPGTSGSTQPRRPHAAAGHRPVAGARGPTVAGGDRQQVTSPWRPCPAACCRCPPLRQPPVRAAFTRASTPDRCAAYRRRVSLCRSVPVCRGVPRSPRRRAALTVPDKAVRPAVGQCSVLVLGVAAAPVDPGRVSPWGPFRARTRSGRCGPAGRPCRRTRGP
jgi:hypothetical protein